ncbi:MAG: hypothetical protein E6X43_11470 [Peptostreptococcaceae bacterium]|nr:hypothetical protein [Peptostreptococcaceae bacterium]
MICSMCIPKFNSYNYEVNSFAKQLCSDIRYVKSNNMLGNLNSFVLMTKENGRKGYILVDKGIQVKDVYLPNNVDITYPNKKIYFRNDGTPNPTGSTIKIFNDKISKEITIVPVSGRVLFKEDQYEK